MSKSDLKYGVRRFLARKPRRALFGISNHSLRRLARRGGVKRISNNIYDPTRNALKSFLAKVICDAVSYTENARRKTVTSMDVIIALKKQGNAIYGFKE